METGFLNFHDEEHFTTSICEQSSGFGNESSLFGANEYFDSFTVPWDQKFSVNQIKVEPNCNEDYEKTFNAWNQHLKELDNSIKCEGGIFIPGLDDPVCFSTGSCSPEEERESLLSTTFIKHGGEHCILTPAVNENEVDSCNTAEPCNVIQVKSEPQDHKPALEAGDLKTLLEQFEAASKPATPKKTKKLKSSNVKSSPTIVNKSIKEALPKEVIERIRESCKRRKEASSNVVSNSINNRPVESSVVSEVLCNVSTAHLNSSSVTERVIENESGKLLRLEHNYCCRDNGRDADPPTEYSKIKQEPSRQHSISLLDYGCSKKDSGLESGELTDSSSIGSPSQTCLSASADIKQEGYADGGDDGAKKKKKLKLEEYWERRKKMKSSDKACTVSTAQSIPTPVTEVKIKTEPEDDEMKISETTNQETLNKDVTSVCDLESNCTGAPAPPKTAADKATPKPVMVSVEVQTADLEIKKEEKPVDEELQKKKEMWLETMRSTYRPRYSSSSSSSSSCYETKSYSRRRGKTSRRYRRRCDSSYSRSRSRSKSSSSSSSSSSEYSSGKSRSKSRRRRRSFSRNRSRKYSGSRTRRTREDWSPFEKQRQVEERRVIYVGQIEDGISKQRLRDRFHRFGYIVDISLHFRERGDNYGFVTFKYSDDAYQAVEHGNDYGLEPKYDICFGGRRAFCKQRYSDLDSVGSAQPYSSFQPTTTVRSSNCNTFDMLLREAQENLRKRSAV